MDKAECEVCGGSGTYEDFDEVTAKTTLWSCPTCNGTGEKEGG